MATKHKFYCRSHDGHAIMTSELRIPVQGTHFTLENCGEDQLLIKRVRPSHERRPILIQPITVNSVLLGTTASKHWD